MVDGVEPFAHHPAFFHLDSDLLGAERLEQHASDSNIKCSGVQPDGKKSPAHDRCKVALFDVEHVGSCEGCSDEVCGFAETLSVVKSIDDSLILLPIVVIHGNIYLRVLVLFIIISLIYKYSL